MAVFPVKDLKRLFNLIVGWNSLQGAKSIFAGRVVIVYCAQQCELFRGAENNKYPKIA